MPTDRNKCQVIFRTMLLQILLKATKIFTKGNKPHKKNNCKKYNTNSSNL